MLYGSVEAGGTKFVCGIGDARGGSIETRRIETTDPDSTIAAVAAFFAEVTARIGPIAGLGIASFGPVDLDPASPRHGWITTTPKQDWQDVDLLGRLARATGVPAAIDTDVNAAALAEATLGAGQGGGQGAGTLAYVTVGTGIGVGVATGGKLRRDGGHPEAGHLLVRRHPGHLGFPGACPYHGDCLEGLASGPAIEASWGASLDRLPADHPAWEVQADYLGQLCATLVLTVAPQRIVIGGGVMAQQRLYPATRAATTRALAGYIARLADEAAVDALIVPPGCTEAPGLIGGYLLGEGAAGG